MTNATATKPKSRLSPQQLHAAQIAQAQKCITVLTMIAQGVDSAFPGQFDTLGAVHEFQAGLDRLKHPKV
ncbi:MAG: hypothetical protein AAFY20_15145 [Cyanobacteria bacterium J06639_14]